ncbi:MAG TPA: redoxin family protein [Bacteroidales bacterium]
MKNRSKLFLLIFLLLITYSGYSQQRIIDKTLEALENIQTAEYIEKNWYVDTEIGDTTKQEKLFVYKLNTNDTLVGALYYIKSGMNKFEMYNGRKYVILKPDEKIATVVDLDTTPSWKESDILMSVQNSFLTVGNILKYANSQKIIPNIKDSNDFKIIELNFKGFQYWGKLQKDSTAFFKATVCIDTKTYLPREFQIINVFPKYSTIQHSYYYGVKQNIIIPDSLFTQKVIQQDYDILNHRYIKDIKVGDKLPNWRVKNMQNKLIKVSDFKGNMILIEIWGIHCGHCIKSIPFLNTLTKKYNDKPFKLFYINTMGESQKDLNSFCTRYKVDYDIYLSNDPMEYYSLPTFILADKNSRVLLISLGYTDDLKNRIDELISKNIN